MEKSSLDNFIFPEDKISLKLIFENIRNYIICGGISYVSFWLKSGNALPSPILFSENPKVDLKIFSVPAYGLAGLLFFANAYQSFLIAKTFFLKLAKHNEVAENNYSSSSKIHWSLKILVYIISVTIFLSIVFLFLSLIVVFSEIAWHSALKATL